MSEASRSAELIKKFTPTPPKQVSSAVKDVDDLIRAQRTPPAGQEPPPAPEPPVPPTPAPPAPGTPPAPAQPPAPQTPQAPPGEQDADHRYRSLEGRYNDQVRVNQELTGRLNDFERLLANMRAAGAVPPSSDPPATPPARLITPEEETEFGAELLDVAGRRAREVLTPELSAMELRFKNLENRLEGVTAVTQMTAQETFFKGLDTAVSDWRTINTSQAFKDWLQFADEFSGRRRHDLLLEAVSRHELDRAVRFFKGFTAATGTPPSPTPPAPTPGNGQAPPAAPTLEDLAAPGRARSSPQPALPAEKPTYTSAWVARFMHEKLNGKWKGREAEAEAIERDIFLAPSEGRFIV